MQAIRTKYIPASNARGSRIRAMCSRGNITIPFSHSGNEHIEAAEALCQKFIAENKAKYGHNEATRPWSLPRIEGELPDGSRAHVFITNR